MSIVELLILGILFVAFMAIAVAACRGGGVTRPGGTDYTPEPPVWPADTNYAQATQPVDDGSSYHRHSHPGGGGHEQLHLHQGAGLPDSTPALQDMGTSLQSPGMDMGTGSFGGGGFDAGASGGGGGFDSGSSSGSTGS